MVLLSILTHKLLSKKMIYLTINKFNLWGCRCYRLVLRFLIAFASVVLSSVPQRHISIGTVTLNGLPSQIMINHYDYQLLPVQYDK